MSVYSGFCTRKQERDYNFCIQKMMFILAKRTVKAINNLPVDATRFAAYFGKLFGMMVRLEEGKYQPPKFSDSLWELAEALGIRDLDYSDNQSQMENSQYLSKGQGNPQNRATFYNIGSNLKPISQLTENQSHRWTSISNSGRSRRNMNKSGEDYRSEDPQTQENASVPPRLTKNYVINYKYYYNNNSPPSQQSAMQQLQSKKISPIRLEPAAQAKQEQIMRVAKIPIPPQTHYDYISAPSSIQQTQGTKRQYAQSQQQNKREFDDILNETYVDKMNSAHGGLTNNVTQNQFNSTVRPNLLIPDSRSLVERERDFLRKFEGTLTQTQPQHGKLQKTLNHIEEESESQMISRTSPQKMAHHFGQAEDMEFDNPEDESQLF